jgi:hypothetical protein
MSITTKPFRLHTRLTQAEVLAEYESKDVKTTMMAEIYTDGKEKARWASRFRKFALPMKRKRGSSRAEVAAYHSKYTADWRSKNPTKVRMYKTRTYYNHVVKLIASGEFVLPAPELLHAE